MTRKYMNAQFPHLIHGADYNPEQWLHCKDEIWEADMCLMQKANCNEMTVGIFSWSVLEPREGEYDFSFLDEIIDKIYQNDGRVVLSTPSAAYPRWMAEKYPQILQVNEDLQRRHFAQRKNYCLTSPVYREKVAKINGLLAKRYGKHPAVIAWHISNEYSGSCRCPLCQKAFRDYLKEKYDHDIAKLNRAYWSAFWSHQLDSFDQVEAPSKLTDRVMHGLNLDWRRFVSHQTLDFMKAEIVALREAGSNLPVTTNMMPALYDLNYHEFAQALDVISWDSYPQWHKEDSCQTAPDVGFWHDFFRSLKGKPFMLMESAPGLVNWMPVCKLKRQGMDKLQSMQAIAHGSDSVQYFQFRKSRGSVEKFHGAVVDHLGTDETRIFRTVQETGALLKTIDEVAGSRVDSRVAIVYDWESRWALDDSQGFQKQKSYNETCVDYYKPFWNRGISVDVIGIHSDWSRYDLVLTPMLYVTSQETIDKIAAFVQNGGTVYGTYIMGMVNETDLCYLGGFPGGALKQVFGIWNEEIDSLYEQERVTVNGLNTSFCGKDFCERIHPQGAMVLATYASEFYTGMPAFTVNTYGKGKAYYQAFRDTGEFKDAALNSILEELGIKGVVPGCGNGVTAHARYADDTQYLFVENYSEAQADEIILGNTYTDMETGEQVNCVSLPPYGIRVLKRNLL